MPIRSPVRSPIYSPIWGATGSRYGNGADALLAAMGLAGAENVAAFDFATSTGRIKDTTTPANNWSGALADKLTYSSPSPKYRLKANGLLAYETGILPEYDAAGVNLGMPFEHGRTNKLLRSQDFTTSWALDHVGCSNPIVTPSYTIAPDGTNTATRLQMNKTDGTFTRIQQIAAGTGNHVFSVWMKNNLAGTANVGLRVEETGLNCAVTPTWQRFNLPWSAASTLSCQILLHDSIVGNDETADISIWGAQCEAGAYASSYIPTTVSQVTRAADSVSLDGALFPLPTNGGMLAVDWTPFVGASVGGVGVMAASSPGNNRADIRTTPTYSTISSGGVTQATLNPGGDLRGIRHKAALRWRTNSARLAINGALVAAEDTSVTLPVSLGKLWFALDAAPTVYGPQAHIRSLVVVSRNDISDADIIAASTL